MKNKILTESGTNEMELLIIVIGDQLFGINVAKIQSIQSFDPKDVTALPCSPPGVMGMLSYRDTTVPLIDLARMLEIEPGEESEREIVVVTEFNKSTNAFKVSDVQMIYRLSWQDFVPLSSVFGFETFTTGSVHVEGKEIMVLDLEHVLANTFPNLIFEDVTYKSTIDKDRIHILFAEDSATIRRGIVSILEKSGFYSITTFANGLDAYTYIEEQVRPYARQQDRYVVITDIEMPQMDGLTVCKKIKQDSELKALPVIIFSSLINDQMIAKCTSVGADNYVTKPEANSLISVIDELCLRA